VNGIANHMGITVNIIKPLRGLANVEKSGELAYLSTSNPLRLFATMSKRKGFSSGLMVIHLQYLTKYATKMDLHAWVFTSDEGFDKILILLRDRYVIFLHQGIEHHLRANFMFPCISWPDKKWERIKRAWGSLTISWARGVNQRRGSKARVQDHGKVPRFQHSWHRVLWFPNRVGSI